MLRTWVAQFDNDWLFFSATPTLSLFAPPRLVRLLIIVQCFSPKLIFGQELAAKIFIPQIVFEVI